MYLNFDKESLYFLTDDDYPQSTTEKIDYKPLLKCKNLSRLSVLFQTLIYYLDLNHCNNIILIDYPIEDNMMIKNFFPGINIYSDYEKDLQDLNSNNLNYAIFFNNNLKDLKFCQIIVEKYQPYLALINYYIDNSLDNYLDGLLLRNYFTIEKVLSLVVRGVGTRKWNKKFLNDRWKCFQCCRKDNLYMNPLTNDNTTIYKLKGLYNGMDETYLASLVIDYLKKINIENNYTNLISLLNILLKDIDLNMIRLLN